MFVPLVIFLVVLSGGVSGNDFTDKTTYPDFTRYHDCTIYNRDWPVKDIAMKKDTKTMVDCVHHCLEYREKGGICRAVAWTTTPFGSPNQCWLKYESFDTQTVRKSKEVRGVQMLNMFCMQTSGSTDERDWKFWDSPCALKKRQFWDYEIGSGHHWVHHPEQCFFKCYNMAGCQSFGMHTNHNCYLNKMYYAYNDNNGAPDHAKNKHVGIYGDDAAAIRERTSMNLACPLNVDDFCLRKNTKFPGSTINMPVSGTNGFPVKGFFECVQRCKEHNAWCKDYKIKCTKEELKNAATRKTSGCKCAVDENKKIIPGCKVGHKAGCNNGCVSITFRGWQGVHRHWCWLKDSSFSDRTEHAKQWWFHSYNINCGDKRIYKFRRDFRCHTKKKRDNDLDNGYKFDWYMRDQGKEKAECDANLNNDRSCCTHGGYCQSKAEHDGCKGDEVQDYTIADKYEIVIVNQKVPYATGIAHMDVKIIGPLTTITRTLDNSGYDDHRMGRTDRFIFTDITRVHNDKHAMPEIQIITKLGTGALGTVCFRRNDGPWYKGQNPTEPAVGDFAFKTSDNTMVREGNWNPTCRWLCANNDAQWGLSCKKKKD